MSTRKVETKDQMLAGLRNAGAITNSIPVILPYNWDESGKFGNKNLGRIEGLGKYYSISFVRGEKPVSKK